MAQPLVPSTAFADAWTQVDRTEDPRFFVSLLDATRSRLLERARTSPEGYFNKLLRCRSGAGGPVSWDILSRAVSAKVEFQQSDEYMIP